MSARIVGFPPEALLTFAQSCHRARLAIADAETGDEALRYLESLKVLAAELTALVDIAAARCDALQDEGDL